MSIELLKSLAKLSQVELNDYKLDSSSSEFRKSNFHDEQFPDGNMIVYKK